MKEAWKDITCPSCNGLVWSLDMNDKEELKKNAGLQFDTCLNCNNKVVWYLRRRQTR